MLNAICRVALVLTFAYVSVPSAVAGTFDCTCKNGTECKVSCGCSGSVSCGDKNCSGSCGACSTAGHIVVAETTAAALYRNAFILTKGRFDDRQLVDIYSRLLARDASRLQVRKIEAPDGWYITVTLQDEKLQHTISLSHSLHLPEQFYANTEIRKTMVDLVAQRAVEILKRKDLSPDYLRQFFPK